MIRYRFRYDARGIELKEKPEAPASPVTTVSTGARPEEAPPNPPAVSFDPIPPLEKLDPDTLMLRDLMACIEEHPDSGLDMELLEKRGILTTPPHWDFVSAGVRQMTRQEPLDPKKIDDYRRQIRKYAAMLQRRQGALENALMWAAYLSQASRNNHDPVRAMQDAIKVLPKGGNTGLEPPFETAPLRRLEKDVNGWITDLLLREESARRQLKPNYEQLEAESWHTWEERFKRYRRGRATFELDRTDLVLRTRWAGPPALFRNDLRRMPVQKWTDTLWIARQGRQDHSVLPVPEWVISEAEKELVLGRKTLLIVVAESDTSPTASWLPSRQHGCLWIRRNRWNDYFTTLGLAEPQTFPEAYVWRIVVETSGEADALVKAMQRNIVEELSLNALTLPPRLVQSAFMGSSKLPPGFTPRFPYIENPQGIDEVIRRFDTMFPN